MYKMKIVRQRGYTVGTPTVVHFTAYAAFSLNVSYFKTYEISLHVVLSATHYGRKVIMQNVFINSTGELISVEGIYRHFIAQNLNI